MKLTAWCSSNNPDRNTTKTKEIITDFKKKRDLTPLHINSVCGERVHTYKYLGILISADLSWYANTTAVDI